jgi:hypothetical protein
MQEQQNRMHYKIPLISMTAECSTDWRDGCASNAAGADGRGEAWGCDDFS